MGLPKKLFSSLTDAAKLLKCSEAEVLQFGAFHGLTLSVVVADQLNDDSGEWAGGFSSLCKLDRQDVAELIGKGTIRRSVVRLLQQGRVDDLILTRVPCDDETFTYSHFPQTHEIEITSASVVVTPDALSEFRAQHSTQAARVNAEVQCRDWLKAEMRGSPDVPTYTRDGARQLASEKFEGLSGRGFKRAWDYAVRQSEAKAWSKPGRRKKSACGNRSSESNH